MRLQRYLSKNKNSKNTQKLPKKTTQCGQKKKDRQIKANLVLSIPILIISNIFTTENTI